MLPYLYDRKGTGAASSWEPGSKGYWRGNLTYSFENVDIRESTYTGYYHITAGYGSGYGSGYGTAMARAIIRDSGMDSASTR